MSRAVCVAALTALLWPAALAYYSTSSYYSTEYPSGECPGTDWQPFRGRCYWRSSFLAPWRMIDDLCRFVDPDARPVSIHDYDQNYIVEELAKSDSWIGLRRYGSTRDWTWADGSEFNYSPITVYKGPKDQCMSIYNSNGWVVRNCDEDLYFICQVDQKVRPTTERPESTTRNPWDTTTRDPWGPTTREPWDTTTRDPWWPTTRDPWWPTTRDPWWSTTRDPWWPTTRDPWGSTTRYPWDTTSRDPWGPTTEYPWHSTTRYPWWPTTQYPYWTTTSQPRSTEPPTSTPCSSSTPTESGTTEKPSTSYPWPTRSEATTMEPETSTDQRFTSTDSTTWYWRKDSKDEEMSAEKVTPGDGELVKAEQGETGEAQPGDIEKKHVKSVSVNEESSRDEAQK